MTTTVTVQVNGRYRAMVRETHADGSIDEHQVDGNYEGSPNPSGAKQFRLMHPATSTFEIIEQAVPPDPC